jgi:CheY-like chemotaxis protein
MITILVIEDDEHKLERMLAFLRGLVLHTDLSIEVARSVRSGIECLIRFIPDLILLDMSLPVFDYSPRERGFQHLSYGGRDILDFLDEQDNCVPVVIVTAFETFGRDTEAMNLTELNVLLLNQYPDLYRGTVSYGALQDVWQEDLTRIIVRTVQQPSVESDD